MKKKDRRQRTDLQWNKRQEIRKEEIEFFSKDDVVAFKGLNLIVKNDFFSLILEIIFKKRTKMKRTSLFYLEPPQQPPLSFPPALELPDPPTFIDEPSFPRPRPPDEFDTS